MGEGSYGGMGDGGWEGGGEGKEGLEDVLEGVGLWNDGGERAVGGGL